MGHISVQVVMVGRYRMACHHLFKAQTYRNHAKARYGLPLPLFGEEDSETGDERGTP